MLDMTEITDDLVRENIAANLHWLLDIKMKKSRYWLAKQTGDYESTIANVYYGKTLCSAALLARIAVATGVSVEFLVSEPKKMSKTG